MIQDWKKLALGFIFAFGGAAFSINCAFAQQITIDGTLGPARTLTGPNYIIPQADGQTVGNNLFQSFGRFNLNAGESANFQSDVNIRNILSRVTGGSPSMIDGRIFTESGNVNLFFINPSGIIFGSNAVINVGSATRGSFIATTADALVWANGSQFSATNPSGASSLLTIVGDPSGFLSSLRPPQPITSSGNNLTVLDGQSLLLLGGNLTFDNSNLQAPGGRVELAGIAGTGIVGLETNGNIFSLNVPDNLAGADVSLQNGSSIDVTAANQGNIAIVGRNVDFIGGSQLRTGIGSGLGTVNSQAGDITVNATGRVTINQASRLSNIVGDNATGNAGNVNIKAAGEILINNQGSDPAISTNRSVQGRGGNVLLESNGSIFVTGESRNSVESVISTFGGQESTDSGDISLNASGAIKLDNAYFVTSRFGGNGGNISLQGNEISLANNSSLVSVAFTRGNSGSIILNSTGAISIQNTLVNTAAGNQDDNTTNPQVGNAGNINISGRSVSVTGGSEISSRSFTGVNSGNIKVNATELVEISGNAPEIPRPESDRAYSFPNTILTTAAESNSTGNAGNISIKAGEIFINNQASDPAISTNNSGQGRGGNVLLESKGSIFVTGQNVQNTDSVISTLSGGQSQGSGDISLNASGAIKLDNAFFVAASFGRNGGNISLQGNEISLVNNSSLVTQAFTRGNSGSIKLNSTGSISIQNSLVNTAVGSGNTPNLQVGNAGNISISGRSVSITGGSEISSRSFNGVNSGNINVNATELVEISGNAPEIPRPDSDRANTFTNTILTTATESDFTGNAGNITIKAGEIFINNPAISRALNNNQPINSISTASNGQGTAGNVSLEASNSIYLNNQASDPAISTISNGQGRGGNVSLATNGSISLIGRDPQANEVISTFGDRNSQGSGDISLNANGSISLENAFLRASTNGRDAGSILVRGNERVSFANNSALTTEALGRGNGGRITVESFGPISLQNSLIATNVGSPSDTISRPELGNAGNIRIQGRSVAITAGSEISSRSFSGANSGNIEVNGTQFVDISGRASQFTRPASDAFGATQSVDRANSFPYTTLATTSEQFARGASGNITVKTPNLRISDGASVRADTRNNSSGGSVNINANVVDITNGGQIFTTAFSSGNAGNIVLNVSDRLNISGKNPSVADINQIGQTTGIFANTSPNSTAQGGNLTINTPWLQVQDGATISVSSPQGQAGNLNITAKIIRLNQGSLTAKTAITRTQEGANIRLKDVDLLFLRNNSFISATANGEATGGNIIIDAKKGFVIAPLGENSDIRASASGGRGGNITINTQGLFGFIEGRAIPGNSTNDIDASSEFNNPGTVEINTLNIDPRRGLLKLPANLVEVSRLVASNCGVFAGKDGSSFTYTGRGGLADSPDDFLSNDVVWSDTRLTNIRNEQMDNAPTSKPFNQTKDGIAIVPAIGWVFNNKGEVTLIASQSETANPIYTPTNCPRETGH